MFWNRIKSVRPSAQPARSIAAIEVLEERRLFTTVNFVLVPNLSTATLSGSGAIALTAQSTGSLKANYSGTIAADVKPHSIKFLPATSLVASSKGKALPGGTAANFAAVAAGLVNAALRGLVFSASSGVSTIAANGAFSVSGATIKATAGKIDFAGTGVAASIHGSKSLVGVSGSDKATTSAKYVVSGGVATITIPIKVTVTFAVIPSLQSQFTFTGQLVAKATLPKGGVK
jgi:hypothetical protein